MGAADTDTLFEPAAPPPEAPDLSRESDGGVVCELRRVWKDLEIIRQSIERDWPATASKRARLAKQVRMQAVIVEAGRRLKARLGRTAGGASLTQEEEEAGF